MITLEVYQGDTFTEVLQPHAKDQSLPTYFERADVVTGAVWDGQTQAALFAPTVEWFSGLDRIDVTSSGTSYSPLLTVTITGGGATSDATARATVVGGIVTAIDIIDPGEGYDGTAITVTITDGTGAGAAATAVPALGWTTGAILVEISATQSATLEANGQYRFRAKASNADRTSSLVDCLVRVRPSPGVGTQSILTYNNLQDMLDIATWIEGVQDADVDQEGFYSQRLKARLWFDGIVVAKFQNNFVGLYGAHSQSAFDFGIGYSIGPNPTILEALAANQLIRRPEVVQVCARYAVGLVGLNQVSAGNMTLAKWGQYQLSKALRDVLAITAEIDTDGDGRANYAANLGTVQTLFG